MSTEQKKNYALPIIVMFALFAMISFVTGLQNPMGVIVKSQFGASNFMSQLGNAANLSLMPLWEFRPVCCCSALVIRRPRFLP